MALGGTTPSQWWAMLFCWLLSMTLLTNLLIAGQAIDNVKEHNVAEMVATNQ